jgi:hypothetical protein
MSFTIFFRPGIAKQGDARNASIILERNSKLDKADQVAVIEEKLSYLLLALENYAKALIKSDKHDLKMYRWISLWFANTEEKRVNQMVESFVQTIPDHKFVGLLYQLCARMVTNKDSKFPILLKYIILKCAKKHPYHTLPIILALANSDADEKVIIIFSIFLFNFQFYHIFPFSPLFRSKNQTTRRNFQLLKMKMIGLRLQKRLFKCSKVVVNSLTSRKKQKKCL